MLFIAVFSMPSSQLSLTMASSEIKIGWMAEITPNNTIPVYQCGYNCAVYILKYFQIKYDYNQLMQLMKPQIKGIPLSDIIRTLELHGLTVSARRAVREEELRSCLTRERIVLIPTDTSGKKGHYYLLLPGGRGNYLLVDAGRSVVSCSHDKIEEYLKDNDGVAVFIEIDKTHHDASKIKIVNEKQDVGKFSSANSEEIAAKYVLENTSAEDVLLKDVLTSCSCLASDCKGRILPAGEKSDLYVRIIPGAWGNGKKTKDIQIVFGDGSIAKVSVEGECINEAELHGLKVQPSEVYVVADDKSGGIIRKELKVLTKEDSLYLQSEAGWLRAKIVEGKNQGNKTILIEIDEDKITEAETRTVHLLAWTKEELPKIKIPIHVVNPKPWTIEPRIRKINTKKEDDIYVSYQIVPQLKNSLEIRIIEAKSDVPGLNFECSETELKVFANTKDIKPGFHSIQIKYSADNKTYIENVYLFVY